MVPPPAISAKAAVPSALRCWTITMSDAGRFPHPPPHLLPLPAPPRPLPEALLPLREALLPLREALLPLREALLPLSALLLPLREPLPLLPALLLPLREPLPLLPVSLSPLPVPLASIVEPRLAPSVSRASAMRWLKLRPSLPELCRSARRSRSASCRNRVRTFAPVTGSSSPRRCTISSSPSQMLNRRRALCRR